MNKKALTLVELMIAMILATVLLIAASCLFVADANIRLAINNMLDATQEVSLAMSEINNTLRLSVAAYYIPNSQYVYPSCSPTSCLILVQGGCVSRYPYINGNPTVTYIYEGAGGYANLPEGEFRSVVQYPGQTETTSIVAKGVSDYSIAWDETSNIFTVTFAVTKGHGSTARSFTAQCKIKAIPEIYYYS